MEKITQKKKKEGKRKQHVVPLIHCLKNTHGNYRVKPMCIFQYTFLVYWTIFDDHILQNSMYDYIIILTSYFADICKWYLELDFFTKKETLILQPGWL